MRILLFYLILFYFYMNLFDEEWHTLYCSAKSTLLFKKSIKAEPG